MATEDPQTALQINYDEAAQEYLRSLTMEQIMEATPQATQREITLESLALVRAQRADFKVFNELLVQYPLQGKNRPGQVVPDNMVVLHDGPMQVHGSYNLPSQPTGPFWVLEYVSNSNKRKDYDDNVRKYEHELRVPYYLLFAPEAQELTLYRMTEKKKYATVLPNEQGRYAIPELELELAILEGWVRYWYRGELLPLPPEWWRERTEMLAQMEKQDLQVEQTRSQKEEAVHRADAERSQKEEAQRQADAERSQKEEAVRRADAERSQKEEAQRQADAERRQKEEAQRQADAERSQKEEAQRQADAERRQKEEAVLRADAERQTRLAFESEMAALRAELAQLRLQAGKPE